MLLPPVLYSPQGESCLSILFGMVEDGDETRSSSRIHPKGATATGSEFETTTATAANEQRKHGDSHHRFDFHGQ
jgi:hypothetical protein